MQDISLYIDNLDTIVAELQRFSDEEVETPDLVNRIDRWANEENATGTGLQKKQLAFF